MLTSCAVDDRFEVVQRGPEYHFRLLAPGGELLVASARHYPADGDCKDAIAALFSANARPECRPRTTVHGHSFTIVASGVELGRSPVYLSRMLRDRRLQYVERMFHGALPFIENVKR